MIVGGYAVAFHGYPRFTKDIDIFFQSSQDNIDKLKEALCSFGFDNNALPNHIFTEEGTIIKFGIEPVRIDLLNKIDGVVFENIESRTVRGRYGEITVSFISKEDLIMNKKASGRAQDIADLEKLEQ